MGDVLSFAELIEALRRGDPQAVAELERLYGRHLRRVVGRKLRQKGVKSLADSVEICQDVWLRILQRPLAAEFATPGDLLAYLETMAENRVRALHRAESSPRRDRRCQDPNLIEEREVLDDEPRMSLTEIKWFSAVQFQARTLPRPAGGYLLFSQSNCSR